MRTQLVYCEHCGGTELSGTDAFLMFHNLTFCCVACRDDYRTEHEARRDARAAAKLAASQLATVAEVMRRDSAAKPKPVRRARAA